MVHYKVTVFRSSRIFNMAAKANNMLWLAEISKIFFSETNELTEPKLYRNDHWNVLYKVTVFYDDRKSKMAAIAGLSLTLDPMGKMVPKRFFSETTWAVETKLPRNDHWKVLYKVCVFYADRKSNTVTTWRQNLTNVSANKTHTIMFRTAAE